MLSKPDLGFRSPKSDLVPTKYYQGSTVPTYHNAHSMDYGVNIKRWRCLHKFPTNQNAHNMDNGLYILRGGDVRAQ